MRELFLQLGPHALVELLGIVGRLVDLCKLELEECHVLSHALQHRRRLHGLLAATMAARGERRGRGNFRGMVLLREILVLQ